MAHFGEWGATGFGGGKVAKLMVQSVIMIPGKEKKAHKVPSLTPKKRLYWEWNGGGLPNIFIILFFFGFIFRTFSFVHRRTDGCVGGGVEGRTLDFGDDSPSPGRTHSHETITELNLWLTTRAHTHCRKRIIAQ